MKDNSNYDQMVQAEVSLAVETDSLVSGTVHPLSFAQQRLWYLDRLEGASATYNMPQSLLLKGHLDIRCLERGLQDLIDRHEVLRCVFEEVATGPLCRVFELVECCLPVEDYQGVPMDQDGLRKLVDAEAAHCFDLANGPLIRYRLLRLSPTEHLFLLNFHHIICDGWSVGIAQTEIVTQYTRFLTGRPSFLPKLELQYTDYAAWQISRLEGPVLEEQIEFWHDFLKDLPPLLELPTDRPRPSVLTFKGTMEPFLIPKSLVNQLNELARQHGVTLFTVLVSAFKLMLYRYSGLTDVFLGTAFANRNRAELEPLIGFLVNPLTLRTHLRPSDSFSNLLNSVHRMTLDVFGNADMPFEQVVDLLQPERSTAHTPLFQIMFGLENVPESTGVSIPGLIVSTTSRSGGVAKYDLTLMLNEGPSGLNGNLEYSTDLFERQTIVSLIENYLEILKDVAKDPCQTLDQITLLTPESRARLLHAFQGEIRSFPEGETIASLFERQVTLTPDAIALCFQANYSQTGFDLEQFGEIGEMTYAELNAVSNRIAYKIIKRGLPRQTPIGIMLERTPELIAAHIGILKAGCAYVPLDRQYPVERLQVMVEACGISLILSDGDIEINALSPLEVLPVSCSDNYETDPGNPNLPMDANQLAYIIFTSGSTGRPKGITIPQRAVVSLVFGDNYAPLDESSVVLHLASPAFDASTFETWGPLLRGGVCVLYPGRMPSLSMLEKMLTMHQVNTLFITTALYNTIVMERPELLEGVKYLMAGGESHALPNLKMGLEKLPNTRISNIYGPTETTTFATVQHLSQPLGRVLIGRPLDNRKHYVLDHLLNLVPFRTPGELLLGGEGLAFGYLDDAPLTALKFVPDPFGNKRGARLYRTGDRVRMHECGSIEYMTRMDNQIKIRGFRVEPNEVKVVLEAHPNVVRAAVVVNKHPHRGLSLIGYVTFVKPTEEDAYDPFAAFMGGMDMDVAGDYAVEESEQTQEGLREELLSYMRRTLPPYMMIEDLVVLEEMPLNANGKINYKALPKPGEIQTKGMSLPGNSIELKLERIWAQTLDLPSVDVNANFFELGGHSLLAVETANRIEEAFDIQFPLQVLFSKPTIVETAAYIRELSPLPQAWTPVVALQPLGERPPIFCVHSGGGSPFEYRELAAYVGTDQPFYGLQPRGYDKNSVPDNDICIMARDYLKGVREIQPEGPYYLTGWSFGGLVAYEMARQLLAEGQDVAMLVLMDVLEPSLLSEEMRQIHFDDPVHFFIHAFWRYFRVDLMGSIDELRQFDDETRLTLALEKAKELGISSESFRLSDLMPILNIQQSHHHASLHYRPDSVLPIPATLIRIDNSNQNKHFRKYLQNILVDSRVDNPEYGWERRFSEDVTVIEGPGDHLTMMQEPHVARVAGILREQYEKCLFHHVQTT